MGSCVSVHKGSETPMKLRVVVGSKNSMAVNPSPVKHDRSTVNGVDCKFSDHLPPKSQPSPSRLGTASIDFGSSKEETFFDSQLYLESDCEDDFYSVKGDFTPSRGNTPVHQTIPASTLKVNGSPFTERAAAISVPQTQISPTTEKKKRLAELFKESLGGDHEFNALDTLNHPNSVVPAKSTIGTPYSSACSNPTPSQELKHIPKSSKSGQCCLPKLLSRRSFGERKNVASPVHSTG